MTDNMSGQAENTKNTSDSTDSQHSSQPTLFKFNDMITNCKYISKQEHVVMYTNNYVYGDDRAAKCFITFYEPNMMFTVCRIIDIFVVSEDNKYIYLEYHIQTTSTPHYRLNKKYIYGLTEGKYANTQFSTTAKNIDEDGSQHELLVGLCDIQNLPDEDRVKMSCELLNKYNKICKYNVGEPVTDRLVINEELMMAQKKYSQ